MNYNNPLKLQKIDYLFKIDNKYPEYSSVHSDIYDSLNTLCNESPDTVIDIIKDSLNNELITTLFTEARHRKQTHYTKISFIATLWEVAELFKIHAYLLSNNKLPVDSLNNKNVVFKQVKKLGFTSRDVDNIRIIRNSKNHIFGVANGKIVTNDKKHPNIQLTDIDTLYLKLSNFFIWSIEVLLMLSFFLPKFLLLNMYSISIKFTNYSKNDIREYYSTLEQIIPELKIVKKKNKLKFIKIGIRRKLKKIRNRIFPKNHFLFSEYYRHSKIFINNNPLKIAELSDEISNNIRTQIYKDFFENFSKNIISQYKTNNIFSKDDWNIVLKGL